MKIDYLTLSHFEKKLDALLHTLTVSASASLDKLDQILHNQQEILVHLESIQQKEIAMSAELDRLQQSVSSMGDAVQAGVKLLGDLSILIRNNVTDPAALTKLADDLDAKKQTLAQAVVDNTPANPTPGPGPNPPPAPQPQQRGGKKP